MKQSGIYQIINTTSKNIYIGSAVNLPKRIREHRCDLKNKTHHSQHLQKAWNKYGGESFKFEVLANCPQEYLLKLEQWFIDSLTPQYNILKKAGSALGYKHSAEVKEKISILNKGRIHSEQSRKNMSVGQKESVASRNNLVNFHKLHQKPVYQYTLGGVFLKKYNSATEAAELIGVSTSAIAVVARGINNICGGFQWRYIFADSLPPVKRQDKAIVVYKNGWQVGIYKNIMEAAKALNVGHSSISSHLAGIKGRKSFGGYTAKEITYEEYQKFILQK